MEVLDGYLKELQKTFDVFRQEDVKCFEEYEISMRAAIESQVAPGMKKQRTSIDEDQDSGVDATTITTSTQASTATSSTTAGNARPSRSAKTAASGNLKLPKLGTKLRQEIKLERITETSSISTKSDAKENDFNSLNIKREKISIGVRSQGSSKGDDSRDPSILVIPNEVNIITLSDDDDDETAADDENNGAHNDVDKMMPPPMVPAPKKLPAKKTRTNQKSAASAESSALETNSSQNSEASSSHLEAKKTKKSKKPKKPVMPIVIKQEKDTDDGEVAQSGEGSRGKKPKSKKSAEKADSDAGSKDATLESVYEDASDKIPSQPSNGLVPSATYVLPKNSAREYAPKVDNVGKSKASLSSILTEDNSDEEEEPPIPLPKNKKKQKELFNPLVQSPMKAKVAAFEKLQEFSSPAQPIRQTRTKTRQLAKQNSETSIGSTGSTNSTSRLPKPTTPSVELRYPIKEHTPLGKSVPPMKTYSAQNSIRTPLAMSTSTKAAGMSRPASAQPTKVRSRDNSVEDQARAKEALLEKKRKADERAKRAQMQREAQEKEKLEKMEKLIKAKQEKEAAREAAKVLKQQQEMQRQLKALEEKRERERKLKAELAEAAKLERDQILSKKIADERAHLDQMRLIRKDESKPVFTFDMLETDDSTDDEETASKSRPNRPSPPAWSLRANAKRDIILQAGVSVNTIDKLFSCKPTTPDLAAIFPQIDSKHLQRNSSAFWNTPPRYSELPKY